MLFLLLLTLNPSGADTGRDVLVQQTHGQLSSSLRGREARSLITPSWGLDPNEISCFFLQEQAPTQVLGLSLFNLIVILS